MVDKDMRTDYDDNIQHGIDDSPTGDAEKGAALGGLGGAVVGGIAGSMVGPVGTVIGAVVGGVAGAAGSGVAVAAVDNVDNDNNMTGLGDKIQYENDTTVTGSEISTEYPAANWDTASGVDTRGVSSHADYTREQADNMANMDVTENIAGTEYNTTPPNFDSRTGGEMTQPVRPDMETNIDTEDCDTDKSRGF